MIINTVKILNDKLDNYLGEINENSTGLELVERYIDLGRQLGKTTQLLNAIPLDGNVIIVSTMDASYWNSFLSENLYNYDKKRFIFAKVNYLSDINEYLRGITGKVLIDNSVIDNEIKRIVLKFYNSVSILPIFNSYRNMKT